MLEPCPACHRHVALEHACPFCGADQPPRTPRATTAGRFSRAAVFAGATLAGCWGGDPAGTTTPQVENHVAPAETGGVEGRITSEDGLLAGIEVVLYGDGRIVQRTHADDDGNYRFAGLPAGTYQVRVSMRGAAPETVTVAPNAVSHADFAVRSQTQHNIPMPYGAPPARRRLV